MHSLNTNPSLPKKKPFAEDIAKQIYYLDLWPCKTARQAQAIISQVHLIGHEQCVRLRSKNCTGTTEVGSNPVWGEALDTKVNLKVELKSSCRYSQTRNLQCMFSKTTCPLSSQSAMLIIQKSMKRALGTTHLCKELL